MPTEYHCQSYWPQQTSARGAPVDTNAITHWLTQMGTVGWTLITTVQVGDGTKPTEMLYYFRREVDGS